MPQRASDIDVIYLNGYGFPAWRGGPMFYADRTGPAHDSRPHRSAPSELGDRWATGTAPHQRWPRTVGTFREIDRMADILPSETILERRADGTLYARSPVALGRYPDEDYRAPRPLGGPRARADVSRKA